jgi:hypothetical protein
VPIVPEVPWACANASAKLFEPVEPVVLVPVVETPPVDEPVVLAATDLGDPAYGIGVAHRLPLRSAGFERP